MICIYLLISMKIFIDSADFDEIKACNETGLIDGVTTNPTLIKRSGWDAMDVYRDLMQALGIDDISMEVMGDYTEMLNQAAKLSETFGSTATIKLPMTKDGLKVCKEL